MCVACGVVIQECMAGLVSLPRYQMSAQRKTKNMATHHPNPPHVPAKPGECALMPPLHYSTEKGRQVMVVGPGLRCSGMARQAHVDQVHQPLAELLLAGSNCSPGQAGLAWTAEHQPQAWNKVKDNAKMLSGTGVEQSNTSVWWQVGTA